MSVAPGNDRPRLRADRTPAVTTTDAVRMREMVDRDREGQQLVDAVRTVPTLIVVSGRRWIGKSFLLERAFARHAPRR